MDQTRESIKAGDAYMNNTLNLPPNIPLVIVASAYQREGIALKWVSRPTGHDTTIVRCHDRDRYGELAKLYREVQA